MSQRTEKFKYYMCCELLLMARLSSYPSSRIHADGMHDAATKYETSLQLFASHYEYINTCSEMSGLCLDSERCRISEDAHFRGDADTRILGQSKAESIRKGVKARTLQSCEGGRRLASDACHRCVLVQHLDKQKPSCKCTFAVKACTQPKALTNW